MKKWIKKHQGLFLIGILLIVARAVQVVIFMYYDNLLDFFDSVFGSLIR